MRETVSRTGYLTRKALEYISSYIDDRSEKWGLPCIESYESGYRDILTGVRAFPALICLVRSRSDIDSFTTRYHVLFGLALKGQDIELLQEEGDKYADLLEDSLRADGHLGGIATDTNNITVETDCTTGFYVVSLECDIEVDRGAFANMIEEDTDENLDMSTMSEEGTPADGGIPEEVSEVPGEDDTGIA